MVTRTEKDVGVDFYNPNAITGNNFTVIQGANNMLLHIKFTNNGTEIDTGYYDIEVYLVTTDSLDFRKSVRFVKELTDFHYTRTTTPDVDFDYDGLNVVYDGDDVEEIAIPEAFQTKGHCQLIFYVDGFCTLPLDYYVIDNPSYNIQ